MWKYYILIFLCLIAPFSFAQQNLQKENDSAEKTRAFALIFSFIQCFPNTSQNLDSPSQSLLQIHQTFNPSAHLEEYINLTDIQNLISFVDKFQTAQTPPNGPFTNGVQDIFNLNLILTVLFHNAENWPLFYNTSVWLLQRVNQAMLFWALMVVASEKFTNTVTVPSAVEIFPQLFLPKNYVLTAAGLQKRNTPEHPLQYWMSDPDLHNFHVHWHMDNPYWWDEAVYGVKKYRKGELFLFMHHQIVCRYNAELLSVGLPEVQALGLQPDYRVPEGFIPDVVNIDYQDFFTRPPETAVGEFDNAGTLLAQLLEYCQRLSQGIVQGFFVGPNGQHVSFEGENGTDILGSTIESSSIDSANLDYYGSFHNFMHRLLRGMLKPTVFPIPGIQAHPVTAMRDPAFYRIHKKVDTLYLKYKEMVPVYTQDDLDFSGVSIAALEIMTRPPGNTNNRWRPLNNANADLWPFTDQYSESRTAELTTYFRTETYDISNAARPCRGVNDEPMPVSVNILDYVPFSYFIVLQSARPTVAYDMVRIFIWPEYTLDGKPLEGDAAHESAIELDRFRVKIEPAGATVITRSSLDSTITRVEPSPGIKQLYNVRNDSGLITKPEIRRACAFPNNLLLPRGTKAGLPFKLTVYVSDETDAEELEGNQFPHYPFCGSLNGKPFPDKRPMGFPFDRPGTRFNVTPTVLEHHPVFGCSPMMKNVKEVKVIIKHNETN